MGFVFKFENLDVYRLAVEVARWMRAQRWPVGKILAAQQGDAKYLEFRRLLSDLEKMK